MDKSTQTAAQLMASSKKVVISTHIMPDGDGLGAEIALFHYLKRLGKEVRIVNPDAPPDRYLFLDKTKNIEVFKGGAKASLNKFDLSIVVDTNDPKRLGALWSELEKKASHILILDHHPNLRSAAEVEATNKKVHSVVDEKSSSIGELLFRFFHQTHDMLDKTHSSFRLSPEIALGLYVSIITDTNSFRYSRTTALSHRIAADLIDYGLQPEEIYQNVYSTKSAQHLRLIGEVLAGVQETPDGSLAWVEISKALRKKFGASSDDTQTIVNFLLLLKKAEVLLLFREEDDGKIKVSLKSKGNILVNGVAKEFGGGGHDFAAGFSKSGTLHSVRDATLKRLKQK